MIAWRLAEPGRRVFAQNPAIGCRPHDSPPSFLADRSVDTAHPSVPRRELAHLYPLSDDWPLARPPIYSPARLPSPWADNRLRDDVGLLDAAAQYGRDRG